MTTGKFVMAVGVTMLIFSGYLATRGQACTAVFFGLAALTTGGVGLIVVKDER
jgi:hypothetical protein